MNYTKKPKFIAGKWYIEVNTRELGATLLLQEGNLCVPITFDSEVEATEYINTFDKKEKVDMSEDSRNNIKLYILTNKAYRQYCKKVRGNEDISYELARRKLTRNIMLSLKVDMGKNRVLYIYGCLHIFTRGSKITWIKNIKNEIDWFYKDMKEYGRLNEVLGINELESM